MAAAVNDYIAMGTQLIIPYVDTRTSSETLQPLDEDDVAEDAEHVEDYYIGMKEPDEFSFRYAYTAGRSL